tara:strand:+ start:402 stop:710 length:309 start_codon:yes stop_codon:yes gene_type:complete
MSLETISSIGADSITTNGQTINKTIDYTRQTCEDPLALNHGEDGECKYTVDEGGGCSSCAGKNKKSNNGLFGMSKKTWIWIILGAIVLYYFTRKGAKAPKVS